MTIVVLHACARQHTGLVVECTTIYGGESHSFVVNPTRDPYRVQPMTISDEFAFKAALSKESDASELLNLYTYSRNDQESVLIHEIKIVLRFPYERSALQARYGFTGQQFVYDNKSREFQYWCGFRQVR
jgi:hypothetical protein